MYLDVENDFNENELNNQDLLPFQLKTDDTPVNGETKKWSKIELENQLTETEYFQKLDDLKLASTSINLLQPSFITMDGDEIDMSSYFYVKLNNPNDFNLLLQEASNKNVIIIGQNPFMPLWYTLRLTSQTGDHTLNVANYFYETGLFSSTEPDFIFDDYIQCSNDPLFSTQWGLENTANNVGTEGVDIDVCNAWSISTGYNINVAVVDSGFELNHPDLNNVSSLSYDAHNNSSPSTVRGNHGTAVAGIIGATKDNSLGVAGVAPNCNLMSASVEFSSNQTAQQLANSINWAWQNGADVINNSWGGGTPSNLINDAISNALNEQWLYFQQGMIIEMLLILQTQIIEF
jgi:subtilisin family serine protease